MADERHLYILGQGVRAWTQWRIDNPTIIPDLTNASLIKAVLNGFNLRQAKLSMSDLSFAWLEGADLSRAKLVGTNFFRAKLKSAQFLGSTLLEANLREADLRKANIKEANLTDVNLRGANLTGADLKGAYLYRANCLEATFERANVSSAWFGYANIGQTVFTNTNLGKAEGLKLTRHYSSSTIDTSTLYSFKGEIPDQFLRSVGVPDTLITYLPSLIGSENPIQLYSCFISFNNRDRRFAERLYADMQKNKVRCWYAPNDMKIGAKIRPTIHEAIKLHDKVLLVLSKNAMESPWVENEVEAALERESKQSRTVLFPIRLDDTVMRNEDGWPADIRRTRHIGDFRNWSDPNSYRKAFERLLRDLRAEAK
jgi:hypothetical protein